VTSRQRGPARSAPSGSDRAGPAGDPALPADVSSGPGVLVTWGLLAVIVLIAAVLRLGWPNSSPPGLHVDEASNAWNAYCLLQLGRDEHDVAMPVFYTKSFGDYRSALYLYPVMFCQSLFGFSEYTVRIPAAVGGVISVMLIYYVGSRLFSRAVALVAAALLAVDPWHLQFTRWGHEGSISPLLILLPIAMLVWAGAPLTDRKNRTMDPLKALLAGLAIGIACYGYATIRLALPIYLIGATLVNGRGWWSAIRAGGQQRTAIVCLAIGVAVTFGPLAWKHLTDPNINLRARTTWVWDSDDSVPTRIGKVLARYPGHFGPAFLISPGPTDPSQLMATPGGGAMAGYALLAMLLGTGWMIARARSSVSARVLLALVILYPAADLLSGHPGGVNALRSLVGVPALVLLAAVGLVMTWNWLRERNLRMARTAAAVYAVLALVLVSIHFHRYFGAWYNTHPQVLAVRNTDIQAACEWLRPRLGQVDAVFWTQTDASFLYAPVLVYLRYEPDTWLDSERVRMINFGERYAHSDLVFRFEKMRFSYTSEWTDQAIAELAANGVRDTTVFIARPGELPEEMAKHKVTTIRDAAGRERLEIYVLTL
jgi:4-amino-4-deoxy-L-arabinose transferase-like glycosyltransferase